MHPKTKKALCLRCIFPDMPSSKMASTAPCQGLASIEMGSASINCHFSEAEFIVMHYRRVPLRVWPRDRAQKEKERKEKRRVGGLRVPRVNTQLDHFESLLKVLIFVPARRSSFYNCYFVG